MTAETPLAAALRLAPGLPWGEDECGTAEAVTEYETDGTGIGGWVLAVEQDGWCAERWTPVSQRYGYGATPDEAWAELERRAWT